MLNIILSRINFYSKSQTLFFSIALIFLNCQIFAGICYTKMHKYLEEKIYKIYLLWYIYYNIYTNVPTFNLCFVLLLCFVSVSGFIFVCGTRVWVVVAWFCQVVKEICFIILKVWLGFCFSKNASFRAEPPRAHTSLSSSTNGLKNQMKTLFVFFFWQRKHKKSYNTQSYKNL